MCSTYNGQELLNVLADTLSPDFFPSGQDTVPLQPLFMCSTYDGQELLDVLADTLCPDFFPPGQDTVPS
jgi:hypothetical protein